LIFLPFSLPKLEEEEEKEESPAGSKRNFSAQMAEK